MIVESSRLQMFSRLTDILKIDHLWILPNLKILSLAFNKIDKIENLEALVNLKELNLTYNSIEKLEKF
jgi:Leucine-rich repeat (LRR) protein